MFAPKTEGSEWNNGNRNTLNGTIPTELVLLSSLEVLDMSKFI